MQARFGTSYDSDRRENDVGKDPAEKYHLPYEGAVYATLWERLAPYMAEFIGTFVLTLTFICNYGEHSDPVWAATSNGFMVMVLMYALGPISGPSFSPSVSLALWLSGRQSFSRYIYYSLVQILGAIVAGVVRSQFTSNVVDIGPHEGYSWFDVGVVEVLYTAMITFVYLNCMASPSNNPILDQNGFGPLAVGYCFIAGGYAARDVSHGVFNSAISIGLGIVDNSNMMSVHESFSGKALGYFVYDLVGSVIGVGAHRIVRPREFKPQRLATLQREDREEHDKGSVVMAEFIGTFFIILTKALNRLSAVNDVGPEAWSVAAALSAMVYSLRGVSGGFFNPAVTLAAYLCKRTSLTKVMAVFYVVVQVLSGIAASAVFALVNEGSSITINFNHDNPEGTIAVAELLFTFLVCYVVLATSVAFPVVARTKQNNIAGLAFGACHTAAGFSIGNISGSLLNPAIVVGFSGLSLVALKWHDMVFLYIIYELGGAILATAVFYVTHSHLYREDEEKAEADGRKPGGPGAEKA